MGWRDDVLAMTDYDWALHNMVGVDSIATAMNEALVAICAEQFTKLSAGTIYINDAIQEAYAQFNGIRDTYRKYGADDTEGRRATMRVLNMIFKSNVNIGF